MAMLPSLCSPCRWQEWRNSAGGGAACRRLLYAILGSVYIRTAAIPPRLTPAAGWKTIEGHTHQQRSPQGGGCGRRERKPEGVGLPKGVGASRSHSFPEVPTHRVSNFRTAGRMAAHRRRRRRFKIGHTRPHQSAYGTPISEARRIQRAGSRGLNRVFGAQPY
jgi:hypothetical protein